MGRERSLYRTANAGRKPRATLMPMRQYDAVISDIDGCLGPETTEPMDTPRVVELLKWNRAAIETGDRPVLTVLLQAATAVRRGDLAA